MAINVTDLQALMYDPARMQQLILADIKNYTINDPTNPFVMLMEATTVLASSAALESVAAVKKIYPSLATTAQDIIHHVSDKELVNIFSHPSETGVVFYVNVRDLKTNGVYVKASAYSETIIPLGTEVVITGIPFTLLNDISVRLYDTGTVFTEQLTSADDLANNSLGVLSSGIVNFSDGESWIALETMIKQLKRSVINKAITISEGVNINVKHTDKYHYSNIYFKNTSTNGGWVKLNKSHSNTHIDPVTPTVLITVMDNLVTYVIPDVYLLSGQVSGELMIELYETVGFLDLPIYKYAMSEYKVNLSVATADPVKATIANITVYANSRDIVNGGSTGYSFEELRTNIINNSLGHETLPITSNQLNRVAAVEGFELTNMSDLVTGRTLTAGRNMARYNSKLVYCKPDVYVNTVNIDLSQVSNPKVVISGTYAMIPSNTLFKEVNGVVTMLTGAEVTTLNSLGGTVLVTHARNNNLFFTPYYYIIDTTTTATTETRVYDLDTPSLRSIRITGKNINILERCNIGKYGIYKTDTGYDLVVTVVSNAEFNNTKVNLLKGQLGLDMYGGTTIAYIPGTYNPDTGLMTFTIDSNFNITAADTLELTNAAATITNTFVDLIVNATIHLYTEDATVTDPTSYLVSEITLPSANVTVFDKETLTVEFGRNVNYLWNKMFTTYSDRKYLTYGVDKPMVYADDVYQADPLTGSFITVVTDPVTGISTTSKTLLNAKGSPVLDGLGVPVMEYRAGDVVLDANNLPVIDLFGGVVRHADILMLEYEYLAATTTVYKNYLVAVRDTLKSWLFGNMVTLNAKLLENTVVLYKSYKSSVPVEIQTESVKALVPYRVRPVVTVYTTRAVYTAVELDNLRTEAGYIIHAHLDKQAIDLSVLKKELVDAIDTAIVSVKVENIDTARNSEIFNVVSPTTRLAVGKRLKVNHNGELVVEYDIDLRIHNV
ncbi:MAG: hypothetical protein Q9M11_02560 [Mariprofundaceae bacterium]|nr:hypothetical protein [Mariprofundaceae bacterium]